MALRLKAYRSYASRSTSRAPQVKMEEEGPTDREYGMSPNQHLSVEWRIRGTTDVNQSRPRSSNPRGGGGIKNAPKRPTPGARLREG